MQLRKHRKKFLSILKSDLLQKGSSDADLTSRKIKRQVQRDMKKIDWNYVPRANLAVTLSFHANNPNIPQLPKLVKYLLDIVCTIICHDDSQIKYLAASCHRPSAKLDKNGANDESIFIEVERLTDYKQKFIIFTKLMQNSEFREYLRYNNHSSFIDDEEDNRIEDLWPNKETASFLNLRPETVKQWHRMTIRENQQKLLSINKLDNCDWTEGPRDFLYSIKNEWYQFNPFIFYIDGFPTKRGKSIYKVRLKNKLKELNEKFPSFGKIIAPLELDIQVSPKNKLLNKDLDNIILGIADVFSNELLEKGSYLHGYRIYMVKEPQKPTKNTLRFKLLPLYEISKFQDQIENVLSTGIQWIEEKIWY